MIPSWRGKGTSEYINADNEWNYPFLVRPCETCANPVNIAITMKEMNKSVPADTLLLPGYPLISATAKSANDKNKESTNEK